MNVLGSRNVLVNNLDYFLNQLILNVLFPRPTRSFANMDLRLSSSIVDTRPCIPNTSFPPGQVSSMLRFNKILMAMVRKL
jgi:hypothetical protein